MFAFYFPVLLSSLFADLLLSLHTILSLTAFSRFSKSNLKSIRHFFCASISIIQQVTTNMTVPAGLDKTCYRVPTQNFDCSVLRFIPCRWRYFGNDIPLPRGLKNYVGISHQNDPFRQLISCVEIYVWKINNTRVGVLRRGDGIAFGLGRQVRCQNSEYCNIRLSTIRTTKLKVRGSFRDVLPAVYVRLAL
jgi:hypothetical protein